MNILAREKNKPRTELALVQGSPPQIFGTSQLVIRAWAEVP